MSARVAGASRRQLGRDFRSAQPGHAQVEQCDLRLGLLDQRDGLRPVGRSADDVDLVARRQQQDQTVTDDGLVIGDHDADHAVRPSAEPPDAAREARRTSRRPFGDRPARCRRLQPTAPASRRNPSPLPWPSTTSWPGPGPVSSIRTMSAVDVQRADTVTSEPGA